MKGENVEIAFKDRLKGSQNALSKNNLEFIPEELVEVQNYLFTDEKYILDNLNQEVIKLMLVFVWLVI